MRSGDFVAQFFFALGGLVGVQGDLSVGQCRLGKAQASAEFVALNFVALKFQFGRIQFESGVRSDHPEKHLLGHGGQRRCW